MEKPIIKMPEHMVVWAVYDRPRGFPDVYVAQKWHVTRTGSSKSDIIKTEPDLEVLRRRLINEESCGGCLKARDGDDPEVVELWLPAGLFSH